MKPLLVVMGVSGSGKSTVGELLAASLGVPFADADDLHSPANVRKMAAGHPLDDADRWPWLRRVGAQLRQAEPGGLVMACSALKRAYRGVLLEEAPRAVFVFLDGSRELLGRRLERRHSHFMAPGMLDSQLDALEPLGEDEPGITVSIDGSPADIVADIRSKLSTL
ncbi:MAG: gluconokinase [Microbacteriaceae bacterium]|nr:gluconokinase [Microbacteriaceae bacterium]